MAKSYITKFTEYVKQCKTQLIDNLKTLGQDASDTETLDSLISKVTNINQSVPETDVPLEYERDPNLPNFDEMFDNDPLRSINGGEYLSCRYYVCIFPTPGTHIIKLATYFSGGSYASRIELSDGTILDRNNTASSTNQKEFTIADNGVYTLENGVEIFYVKSYGTTASSCGVYSSNFSDCLVELLQDSTSLIQPGSSMKHLRYIRNANTSGTVMTAYKSFFSCWNPNCYVVFDGDVDGDAASAYSSDFTPIIKVNGVLQNTGNINKIGIDHNNHYQYSMCPYLRIPEKSSTSALTTVYLQEIFLLGLYVPDWVETLTNSSYGGYASNRLKRLHLGNGLTGGTALTNSSSRWNALKDLTVSSGAFSKNTTALTINFSSMTNITDESIDNIVTNFADRTGMVANTLKLPLSFSNRMTTEQIEILTNKNWTVTFALT